MAKLGNVGFSISCTTRAPRPGETDGVDYYFISKSDFEQQIADGKFIEYAEVFGNYYGTLRSEVVSRVEQGNDVFLDIDVQGAMQIKEKFPQDELLAKCSELILVAPPSFEILEQRLRNRQTETEEVIQRRLGMAKTELAYWKKYDYLLINDQLEQAVSEMTALVMSLRKASKRMKDSAFYG
jgi:guanylate kinase